MSANSQKKRCEICANMDVCNTSDFRAGCKNGEYFYAMGDKQRITTANSRNSGNRHYHLSRNNQMRRGSTIDQFLQDLEYQRREWFLHV